MPPLAGEALVAELLVELPEVPGVDAPAPGKFTTICSLLVGFRLKVIC